MIIALSGIYSRFRISISLDNVYQFRREAKAYGLPIVFRYFYSWASWLTPLLIGYYIRKKNLKIAVSLLIIQLLMFGFNGMKGPLFLALVVIIVNIFLPRISLSSMNTLSLLGFCMIGTISIITYKLSGNYAVSNVLINRLSIMPVDIFNAYFQFFVEHTPDYFRNSFLRYLGFRSPYSNIPHLISLYYYGIDQGANSGLISDAITNFGIIGIIIMPVIVAFFIKLFDSVTYGLDERMVFPIALYLVIMLISLFLLQVMLTGGGLMILLLAYYMNQANLKQCIIYKSQI